MNINVIVMSGSIEGAPVYVTTEAGTKIARFTLSLAERRRRGRRVVEVLEHVPCAAVGDLADYLDRKGARDGDDVVIRGRWETRPDGPQCLAEHVELR